jgi:hypothetical protein
VAGAVTFTLALLGGQPRRAWQAWLINFLFFTGIAQSGVAFSAAYRITKGKWGDAYRRMGESLCFFLPVSFLLFLIMMTFGARHLFPWVDQPLGDRKVWLNLPFMTVRDGVALAALFGLSFAYVYASQHRFFRPGAGQDQRWERRAGRLAPVLLIVHGLALSLVAFDLVMSLDVTWYSTLFGWYFFVGAFYAMLALLALSGATLREGWGLERHLTADQSHDLGRLLFGFCLLTGGLFWAQWLVFWYGDLPEEIAYIIRRYYEMPFAPLAWAMTYGAFVVPLVVLLSKSLKRKPRLLAAVSFWILACLWLERYVWIVPSIWTQAGAPLAIELLITGGFAGAFVWGWICYNRLVWPAAVRAPGAGSCQHGGQRQAERGPHPGAAREGERGENVAADQHHHHRQAPDEEQHANKAEAGQQRESDARQAAAE